MTKRQIIQHAKDYLDLLAQGVDPISRSPIPEDSAACQPQLRKCFAYVSSILHEMLDHHGFVDLQDADAPDYELVAKKQPFHLTDEEKQKIYIVPTGTTPTVFLRYVNNVANLEKMERLTPKAVNTFLQKRGLLVSRKNPTMVQKTFWSPTPTAIAMGFVEITVTDPETGEIHQQLRYSREAQEYLIQHLDEIQA